MCGLWFRLRVWFWFRCGFRFGFMFRCRFRFRFWRWSVCELIQKFSTVRDCYLTKRHLCSTTKREHQTTNKHKLEEDGIHGFFSVISAHIWTKLDDVSEQLALCSVKASSWIHILSRNDAGHSRTKTSRIFPSSYRWSIERRIGHVSDISWQLKVQWKESTKLCCHWSSRIATTHQDFQLLLDTL